MYIVSVPNRNSPPAVLLRETYRKDGKVKNRTLANLSSLPSDQIEMIRRILKGEKLLPVEEQFEVISSRHHGHIQAVAIAMKQLGFESLLATRTSRERNIIVAMVAARILEPDSKLATTRWWNATTLPEIFNVKDADENDLYAAMDWLLTKQSNIEKKLASRHLKKNGQVLYDLTSSYFEGSSCPLAALGHNRDGKKGKLQVNYGLLTDARGCPVSVSVFKGNTADPNTLLPQVNKLRGDFGIKRIVLVGDRGMISQKQIDSIKEFEGMDWITALRSESIRNLVESGSIQMGLFDERNLFELTHPDYPGERLVACRNIDLGRLRANKRESLLTSTINELNKVSSMVERGTLKGKDNIGIRVGKVVNKYKVAKHFILNIEEKHFDFRIDKVKVASEAALDGIYILRTSIPKERLSTEDTVRSYKNLSQVERAFRSFKSIDLKVRPIYHWLSDRVKAHIFLCMLAYYVEWHMREALRPMLFCDEDQEAKKSRDPIAPAKRSKKALEKISSKLLEDGSEVHSFQTLLKMQSTIVCNTCCIPSASQDGSTFEVITTPSAKQQQVYDLLKSISLAATGRNVVRTK